MKYFCLFFILLLVSNRMFAQDWRFNIDDSWFQKYGINGLQVGDKMPDIPFGTIVNNYTGKKRWSELKGKLVILDFWGTNCSSCIAGFPKMEKLQKEFGDRIQIFLVNPFECVDSINTRLKKSLGNKFKMPNLPSIVANAAYDGSLNGPWKTPYDNLFPSRGYPHHVWIDKDGSIIVRGNSYNTYAQKIRNYLKGEKVSSLASMSNVPSLTFGRQPYYSIVGNKGMPAINFGIFITHYNNKVNGNSGSTKIDYVDSLRKTRTTTFINENFLDIYFKTSFGKSVLAQNQKAIWREARNEYFSILPSDTLNYTSNFKAEDGSLTDEEFVKSRYCLEHIVPLDYPQDKQNADLLSYIDRYFAYQLGITAKLRSRNLPCYVLVKDEDNLKAANGQRRITRNKSFAKDGMARVFQNFLMRNKDLMTALKRSVGKETPLFIMNETGWPLDKKEVLGFSNTKTVRKIDDFRILLKENGLDIQKVERSFDFLVFENHKTSSSIE